MEAEGKVPLLSIVVPCYNEAACVGLFVQAVTQESLPVAVEFVFVDDGSTDETLARIKALAMRDERVRWVSFSRNFGKEAALLAGLRHSRGDYVVTMDVDLQDPPEKLPEMLSALREEGYDCVATRRVDRRGEPPIRSWFARRFYWVMRHLSEVALVDGARDYRLMTRQVVEAILALPECNRFTKGIYQWVGFRTKWIAFENVERVTGESKWSFWRLFRYSLEGILSYSTAPLQLASLLGLLCCVGAFVALMVVFFRALFFSDPVCGWPSLVCIIVFLGGLQLFVVGILGAYLAKTYLETKRRPLYLVREAH